MRSPSPVRQRRGFALAMSLLAIVVIGAMVAGGYLAGIQYYRIGRNSLVEQRAMAATERAVLEIFRADPNVESTMGFIGATCRARQRATARGPAGLWERVRTCSWWPQPRPRRRSCAPIPAA